MQVTITAVNQTQAPKGYKVAEVKYLRDGKEESRKLMSFVDENVFAQATSLHEFPVEANIVLKKELNKKDGKEYWNWKGIEVGNAAQVGNTSNTKGTPTKVAGSNYETPAERARRQVYIVRQSSVSSAIELFKANSPKGGEKTIDSIIEDAKRIEQFVMDIQPLGEPE